MIEFIEDASSFASAFALKKQSDQDQVMTDVSHSNVAHLMKTMNLSKKVSDEDLLDLEDFRIDFNLVDMMVKKLTKCFPSDE